jgi:hypothetical protein
LRYQEYITQWKSWSSHSNLTLKNPIRSHLEPFLRIRPFIPLLFHVVCARLTLPNLTAASPLSHGVRPPPIRSYIRAPHLPLPTPTSRHQHLHNYSTQLTMIGTVLSFPVSSSYLNHLIASPMSLKRSPCTANPIPRLFPRTLNVTRNLPGKTSLTTTKWSLL